MATMCYGDRAPRLSRRLVASLVTLVAMCAQAGCHPRAQTSTRNAPAVGADSGSTTAASLTPYRNGRWRLASSDSLDHVRLWVSEILIRRENASRQAPFTRNWLVEPPPPARSDDDALALATSIAARAADAPQSFASLARQYSEDVVTAAGGGSVGGIMASVLHSDPAILDALAAIRPGEVSRVVESRHGYLILLRRPPPSPVTFSARRILIDYDRDSPGQTPPSTPSIGRSRDTALALARDAAAKLRASPEAFNDLLAQYASPEDQKQGGDFGVWTNVEPGPFERARELLAQLEVGGVTDPIDSPAGFGVFVRTPVPSNYSEYAARVIRIHYTT
jgi:hypothetical protein